MAEKIIGGATVTVDDDGFLTDSSQWTKEVAEGLAKEVGIDSLTDRHWVVINYSREEYLKNGDAPTLRRITKRTDVSTKEIYKLFPGGPAKVAAKIAGLPKPTGCI